MVEEVGGVGGRVKGYGGEKLGKGFERGGVIERKMRVESVKVVGEDDVKLLGGGVGMREEDGIEVIGKVMEKLEIK